MPCMMDDAPRGALKEAAGFEFRQNTLSDLRNRGILSDKEYKRKLKRSLDRQQTWERERREADARAARERELARQARNDGPRAASDRERFLAACPDYGDLVRRDVRVSMDTMYFSAVVIQKVWRGVLTRLVSKCIVIQAYWRGCMTRMRKARGYYAKARRSLRMVRGLSGSSMGGGSPKQKRRDNR